LIRESMALCFISSLESFAISPSRLHAFRLTSGKLFMTVLPS
jgi:hypothetical protein